MRHVPLSLDELAALGRQRSGGVELTDGLARLHGLLQAHAFFTPHCCPSQALLAETLGVTREWVNRMCRHLWELGLICWAKARRIGSRWDHNVYRLRHWAPPPRARVMALLDRIRGRRQCLVHTEGTTNDDDGRTRAVVEAETPYEPLFEEVYVDARGSPRVVASL